MINKTDLVLTSTQLNRRLGVLRIYASTVVGRDVGPQLWAAVLGFNPSLPSALQHEMLHHNIWVADQL